MVSVCWDPLPNSCVDDRTSILRSLILHACQSRERVHDLLRHLEVLWRVVDEAHVQRHGVKCVALPEDALAVDGDEPIQLDEVGRTNAVPDGAGAMSQLHLILGCAGCELVPPPCEGVIIARRCCAAALARLIVAAAAHQLILEAIATTSELIRHANEILHHRHLVGPQCDISCVCVSSIGGLSRGDSGRRRGRRRRIAGQTRPSQRPCTCRRSRWSTSGWDQRAMFGIGAAAGRGAVLRHRSGAEAAAASQGGSQVHRHFRVLSHHPPLIPFFLFLTIVPSRTLHSFARDCRLCCTASVAQTRRAGRHGHRRRPCTCERKIRRMEE